MARIYGMAVFVVGRWFWSQVGFMDFVEKNTYQWVSFSVL